MNRDESATNPLTIRILLFLASSLYACALSTGAGRQFTNKQTWSTVVLGVGLTLGFLHLEDEKAANKAMWAFFWSGTPMIARSLILQTIDLLKLEERWRG